MTPIQQEEAEMDERECVELLRAIRTLALLPYPWPQGAAPVADIIVYTLGEIAGHASRAINIMEGELPSRFGTPD
jgi:hypothetical protein